MFMAFKAFKYSPELKTCHQYTLATSCNTHLMCFYSSLQFTSKNNDTHNTDISFCQEIYANQS